MKDSFVTIVHPFTGDTFIVKKKTKKELALMWHEHESHCKMQENMVKELYPEYYNAVQKGIKFLKRNNDD